MPTVDRLPTQSPLTVEALRTILSLDSVEERLTAAELALSNLNASISIPATNLTVQEDTVASGDLFTNATTPEGTQLIVLEYYVTGVVGSFPAGQATPIPNVGTLMIYADGEWTFTPGANYNGVVPLVRFIASNGTLTRMSVLTITVGAFNDPVTAVPDGAMTPVNTPVTLNPLGNDYDPEGSPVTLQRVNEVVFVTGVPFAVPNGTVVVHSDSTITFTPNEDYVGATSFSYRVSDGTQFTLGTVNIQVGFENILFFSPVSPIFEGDYFDEAHMNFGNTAMQRYGPSYNNGVNVSDSTYTSQQGNFDITIRESWLYDRATQIYRLYLRTVNPITGEGDPSIRAKAIEFAESYFDGVTPSFNGADFTVGDGEPGDVKYLYPVIAWWYERETGDAQYRATAHDLYTQARASFPIAYSTGTSIWTERSMNYAIQACLAEYMLTGDATALTAAESYFQTLVTMSAATGAPLHPLNQHEGSGGTTPVTSPWMGALLVETLIQLYRINGDENIVVWIARYADFLLENAFYINNQVTGYLGHYVPAYLVGVGFQQRQDNGPADDGEHCFDVAQLLMKGVWAKEELTESTIEMRAMVNDLLIGARFVFDTWTRTSAGFPRYRVSPSRKWGWWFNGAYSKLYFAGLVALNPINEVLPSISGDTPAGSTLGLDIGEWFDNPTITQQWYQYEADSGTLIAIAGADETTYVTQSGDNAKEIYAIVSATNAGGTIRRQTNRIMVTTAGSPVITVQPENSVVASGGDAVFTVTASGNPTLTYVWRVSTNGGNSWDDIANSNSNTLTLEDVTVLMSGNLYACRVTNDQGVAVSDSVTLSVTAQLNAVQFTASQGATLLSAILPSIANNFTMEAVVSFNGALSGDRRILSNEYAAGRVVSYGVNNVFQAYNIAVGDTQSGWVGGSLPINPTDDVWYLITVSADPVTDTGLFRATIQELAGGTLHSITRDKGIDGNLTHVGFSINGGGAANAGLNNMKFQYVRAFNSERNLTQIGNDRLAVNANEALFWWVFEDNGVGGVTVRDASGNNRVPTLTGGTLVAGPVVPSI